MIALLYATRQAWKLLEEPRGTVARVVRKMRRRTRTIQTTMQRFLPHLPKVPVRPMSRPKVKFKARRHSVKSYRLRTFGHRRNAIMTVRQLQAAATARNGLNHLHFDAESVPIRVDNCCSKCITNDIKDLVPTSIKKTTKRIRGFRGEECAATCRGTIRWSWDDDQGLQHVFLIPNSYFVPQAMSRLLCPQHWAQEAADHSPI